MGKPKMGRPSAAMIVAVIALSGAVAGTAIAGPDALTSGALTKKKVKKIAKKQAVKQIRKIPRAYALIDQDDVRSDAPSKGITSADVSNPVTGFYCIDLDIDPVTAAANEEAGGGAFADGMMAVGLVPGLYDECPSSAEAEVTHIDASLDDYSDDPFYIQFRGEL